MIASRFWLMAGLATFLAAECALALTTSLVPTRFEAAKKLAASGAEADRVVPHLEASLADGSFRFLDLKYGSEFKDFRSKNWADVVDRLDSVADWVGDFDAYLAREEPLLSLVWRTERWNGRPDSLPSEIRGTFRQFAGSYYAFAGDYRSAELIYPAETKVQHPEELGYDQLIPATDLLVEAAKGRRVVLLNESHGRSDTRAANFLLIRRLIDQGFTHLALEAISAEAASNGCSADRIDGNRVVTRGYVSDADGFYTNDPILAETVRYALGRGVKVFGYDTSQALKSAADREEHQAEQIACVMEASSTARLIVVGGFAHISERSGGAVPGGAMGRRLSNKLGLDPLTVESTVLLKFGLADASILESETDSIFLVSKPQGKLYALPGYDFTVAIRSIGDRRAGNRALTLGGHRQQVVPSDLKCTAPPCIFEAVAEGTGDFAVPLDRCMTRSAGAACPLFVPAVGHSFRVREGDRFAVTKAEGAGSGLAQ